MTSWMKALVVMAVAMLALACGGSSDDPAPGRDGGVDSGGEASTPPTGIEACKAWELGAQPIDAMSACITELGADEVTCVENVRQYWHLSCAGDCVGTEGDYLDDLDCYCECMVVYGTPYDGDAGSNCELGFGDLYDCWVSHE